MSWKRLKEVWKKTPPLDNKQHNTLEPQLSQPNLGRKLPTTSNKAEEFGCVYFPTANSDSSIEHRLL